MIHIPVLQKEVIQYLNPKPNENFIDCTIGEGGHTAAILEKNKPRGKVLGIEIDPELYKALKSRMAEFPISNSQFPNRLVLVNDSFVNLKEIGEREKFQPISGILFDLGLSSWHLEKSGRGFSFQKDEPLDMRFHVTHFPRSSKMCYELTAEKIVNEFSEEEIERILRNYGEEKFAKRIAQKIIEEREKGPIKTTFQLVEIIKKSVPKNYERGRIHPATRTFQALRIAVNGELSNLKKVLPQALKILEVGGRLVIISFHSLEDRIVKNFYRNRISIDLKILTKKPLRPSIEEIKINPRSRSAKLRAAIKIKSI